MMKYPYNIPARSYRGNDKAKRFKINQLNQAIMQVNQYIQTKMTALNIGDEHIFSKVEVASATGVTMATAHDILSAIDGGQHGVTFVRAS